MKGKHIYKVYKVGDSLNMGIHFMEAIQVRSMTTLQIWDFFIGSN
jgi:hypothetical protein